MNKKLFVGGLPWAVDDNRLREVFEQIGEVESANVLMDRETGRSRGFGFVVMTTEELAAEAIKQLDGKELDGRKLIVNEAKPQEDRGGDRRGGYRDNRRSNY